MQLGTSCKVLTKPQYTVFILVLNVRQSSAVQVTGITSKALYFNLPTFMCIIKKQHIFTSNSFGVISILFLSLPVRHSVSFTLYYVIHIFTIIILLIVY